MALIKCPDCGNDISDIAPTCPRCGRPMSTPATVETTSQSEPDTLGAESAETQQNAQKTLVKEEPDVEKRVQPNYFQLILGILGSLSILGGVFMPLVRGSGEAFATLFGAGSLIGLSFLLWGLIALGLVAVRRFREIAIPSVVVLGLTVFLYIVLSGQEGGSYLEYGFGWALLVGGSIMLVISAALPSRWGTRFPVLLMLAAVINGVISFQAVKDFSEMTTGHPGTGGSSRHGNHSPSSQAVLGIDSNPFEGSVTLVSISLEGIPMTNSSGGTWDNINPNPDPFLVITLNGETVHTTSARSESSGSASWSIERQMFISESSQLGMQVWDEDISQHDLMFSTQFDGDQLTWGVNDIELENGTTITLVFR
ncbi:MAG: zinc-ribbon domain-containing protein [Dehalococcoidia bacterium]|nr:zinc-ribbon domain-containing protein [Dehalococcoidia bacterium]